MSGVRRGAARLAAGTAMLAAGGWMMRALNGTPAALGATPSAIGRVTDRSPHAHHGMFRNLEPPSPWIRNGKQHRMLLRDVAGGFRHRELCAPIPTATPSLSGAVGDLAVTWMGHATALIEVDGYRVLTDPLFGDRCSPSDAFGPKRMHPVPVEPESLPAIDVIVISHDHYDHLDMDSITALASSQRARFVVPLGVGAHLRAWGITDERVTELDWGEHARVGDLVLTCTPARHFSGRFLTRNLTQWSSWAIAGTRHRVYFGGDTGYTPNFGRIAAEHGPFDATLLPIGAYHPAWSDIHMNPEEAVAAHRDLTHGGPGVLVPIHWCTFQLAPHRWDDPPERLLAAAGGIRTVIPRPGERVVGGAGAEQPGQDPGADPWWRQCVRGH